MYIPGLSSCHFPVGIFPSHGLVQNRKLFPSDITHWNVTPCFFFSLGPFPPDPVEEEDGIVHIPYVSLILIERKFIHNLHTLTHTYTNIDFELLESHAWVSPFTSLLTGLLKMLASVLASLLVPG